MALTIVAQFQAVAGREDELEMALKSLVMPTLAETGCEIYELHRSVETPGFFHFHEIWTSPAYWEAHMRSPHLQDFAAGSDELVESSRIFQLEKIA